MVSYDLEKVEGQIMEVLKDSTQSPRELLELIHKKFGTNADFVREALWRLTDKGKVRLNRKQKLEAVQRDLIRAPA